MNSVQIKCLGFLVWGISLSLTAVNCHNIKNGNDTKFEWYLHGIMEKYPPWLKENHLDPSPAAESAVMRNSFRGVCLECEISNHHMSGNSKSSGKKWFSQSFFSEHTFEIGQDVDHSFRFPGNFTCTGVLKSEYYTELTKDYMFTGRGTFHVTANHVTERAKMYNVGITRDYKLNMTHSWVEYFFDAANYKFFGEQQTWSKDLVQSKYMEDVRDAFADAYNKFSMINSQSFPAGVLLERYMREVAKEVDLRQIMPKKELPKPYLSINLPHYKLSTTNLRDNCTAPDALNKMIIQETFNLNFMPIFYLVSILLVVYVFVTFRKSGTSKPKRKIK